MSAPKLVRKARIRKISNQEGYIDNALLSKRVLGVVKMTLKGATNLTNTDTVGYSDPYCIVRASFDPTVYGKTKVKKDSLNPRWDQTFEFLVDRSNSKGDFHINLWDYDRLSKDDWLGLVTIPLYSIVHTPEGVSGSLQLHKETKSKKPGSTPGSLLVEISFKPAQATKRPQLSLSLVSDDAKDPPKTLEKSSKDKKSSEHKLHIPHKSSLHLEKKASRLAPAGNIVDRIEPEEKIQSLYLFKTTLGEGATAEVKLSTIIAEKKEVAIKIVNKNSEDWDPISIQAFKNEAAIMKKANSEFLLLALHIHETPGFLYIVMDLVLGGDLFAAIENSDSGCLDEKVSKKWLKNIILGVQFLHEIGVVHRDLKPENILLTSKNYSEAIAKVVDYGAADFFTAKEPYLTDFAGTLSYMAPEIISGEKYTKAVDIWSLGVVAFVMLSGGFPFDEDEGSILEADLQFDHYWDDVCPLAQVMIAGCLNPDVEKRITIPDLLENPWFKN